ncbi:uncharacterized protein STEHIDRAFT_113331 [Stereum hirsutum FP-91666 SS1]|uniref:uncharacterized protein n=1 Tax=Stereum hirsutum (strain FP-91666) TaxID=721885 RepID=UPI0004449B64|nr:uncharacterized protein STEHIDRAFT_113331 [Stereum hirsutum FP-91666 SS1]EIM84152.1 hypothetical protein STEHIDRAFT_113331 [Stereum hirsutum FP-91666 SS1]
MPSENMIVEAIASLTLGMIEDYFTVSAQTLWVFDYIQTLPMEMQVIWCRQLSGVSILYLINRYIMMSSIAAYLFIATPGPSRDKICDVFAHIHYICGATTVIATSALFTMRIFALHSRKIWIIFMAMVLVSGRVAVDYWTSKELYGTRQAPFETWYVRCRTENHSDIIVFRLQLATTALALAFDLFVFAMTLSKAYFHVREMRRFGKTSILELILRDGGLYFGLVSVILIPDITLHILALCGYSNENLSTINNIFSTYNEYIPNIVISRLVLNLKTYDDKRLTNLTHGPSRVSLQSITFARRSQSWFMGNIGQPLDHEQWTCNDEMESREDVLDIIPENER